MSFQWSGLGINQSIRCVVLMPSMSFMLSVPLLGIIYKSWTPKSWAQILLCKIDTCEQLDLHVICFILRIWASMVLNLKCSGTELNELWLKATEDGRQPLEQWQGQSALSRTLEDRQGREGTTSVQEEQSRCKKSEWLEVAGKYHQTKVSKGIPSARVPGGCPQKGMCSGAQLEQGHSKMMSYGKRLTRSNCKSCKFMHMQAQHSNQRPEETSALFNHQENDAKTQRAAIIHGVPISR